MKKDTDLKMPLGAKPVRPTSREPAMGMRPKRIDDYKGISERKKGLGMSWTHTDLRPTAIGVKNRLKRALGLD